MPKAPNQKYKLFYILELLRSESDEKHPVTMPQIISYLKQNGIHAERKSVYSDMEALQILGYDVVCQKNPAGYYLGSREFELAELKLLVDAVQASKFITQKQSRNLIEKLERFTSRHEANRLQRQVCVNDRVKTENLSSLYLTFIRQCTKINRLLLFTANGIRTRNLCRGTVANAILFLHGCLCGKTKIIICWRMTTKQR